jgi:phage terminase large subunit GpA-like protein
MLTDQYIDADIDYMIQQIEAISDKKIIKTVVEVAEEIRVFPEGTPFPGPCRYDKTPYMEEIALECSPQSDTEEITIMKAGQMGGTAMSAENLILFHIVNDTCPILYVTATDELAKKWSSTALEPMIEHSGVTSKLKASTKKSANKATGNAILNKKWSGGLLDIITYGKIDQLRSISYRIVILDEEDTATNAAQKGVKQGKFRDIAEARTMTFRGRKKILRISTPLIKQFSEIWKAFLDGDQRYLHIECPECGFLQHLDFFKDLFKNVRVADRVVIPETVYCECQNPECSKKIKNSDKVTFLKKGASKWVPANKTPKPKRKSYHLPAIYAAIGMDTWEDLAQKWVEAQGDADAKQVFYNMKLGLPYEETTEAPPAETLHVLKGNYVTGELPDLETEGKILFVTLAADVQAGNMRDGEVITPPRIECELVGHGAGFRTYGLGYWVIEGATTHYNGGAFAKFRKMIENREFGPAHPVKVFIDSRHQPDVVRQFCQGSNDIHPIMGEPVTTPKKSHIREEQLIEYIDSFGQPLKSYKINVNPLKRIIYNNLLLRKTQEGEYLDGHCMFPRDYTQRFFEMLTAERMVTIMKNGKAVGYNFEAGGRRNEALDIRGYNLAAAELHAWIISSALGYESIAWRAVWKFYSDGGIFENLFK